MRLLFDPEYFPANVEKDDKTLLNTVEGTDLSLDMGRFEEGMTNLHCAVSENAVNAAGELLGNVGRNFIRKVSPRPDYRPDIPLNGKVSVWARPHKHLSG